MVLSSSSTARFFHLRTSSFRPPTPQPLPSVPRLPRVLTGLIKLLFSLFGPTRPFSFPVLCFLHLFFVFLPLSFRVLCLYPFFLLLSVCTSFKSLFVIQVSYVRSLIIFFWMLSVSNMTRVKPEYYLTCYKTSPQESVHLVGTSSVRTSWSTNPVYQSPVTRTRNVSLFPGPVSYREKSLPRRTECGTTKRTFSEIPGLPFPVRKRKKTGDDYVYRSQGNREPSFSSL